MGNAEIEGKARGKTALLVIDMINDLDFVGGRKLLGPASRAADAVLSLSAEARRRDVPVVYVNDNYGQWHSERSRLVEHCSRPGALGRDIVKKLQPEPNDYFVIKPQFSGFYSTNLPVLLPKLGASRLILTGVATDICVLFTAGDAHMREYQLWVPSDCVASPRAQRTEWALEIMQHSMQADTRPTSELRLSEWLSRSA